MVAPLSPRMGLNNEEGRLLYGLAVEGPLSFKVPTMVLTHVLPERCDDDTNSLMTARGRFLTTLPQELPTVLAGRHSREGSITISLDMTKKNHPAMKSKAVSKQASTTQAWERVRFSRIPQRPAWRKNQAWEANPRKPRENHTPSTR